MSSRLSSFAAATLAATLVLPAHAQERPVAIRAGQIVLSSDRAPLEGATLLLQDGKIAAVGVDLALPEGAVVVDAPDLWAIAGLVDAACALSLVGETDEVAEAFQPDVSTRQGFDPTHRDLRAALAAGITTALVTPGDKNLLGGEATLVKTTGAVWRLGGGAPLKLALGADVLVSDRSPTSRAGALDALRDHLQRIDRDGEDPWAQLGRGERVALWRVDAPLDARTVLDLADQHGLALLLQLAPTVTAPDLDRLSLEGRPVVVGPFGHGTGTPALRVPAAVAARKGLPVFASGAPAAAPAGLRLSACLAVRYGLAPAAAFDGLTRAPANALGIGERVGTLDPGKDADVVLLDGPPLDPRSRVVAVYVGGQQAFVRAEEEDRP